MQIKCNKDIKIDCPINNMNNLTGMLLLCLYNYEHIYCIKYCILIFLISD